MSEFRCLFKLGGEGQNGVIILVEGGVINEQERILCQCRSRHNFIAKKHPYKGSQLATPKIKTEMRENGGENGAQKRIGPVGLVYLAGKRKEKGGRTR